MYVCLWVDQENVTRLANYRRVALEEFLTTHEASVPTFLALVSDIRTCVDGQTTIHKQIPSAQ